MNQLIIKWFRRTFASVFFLGYIPGAPGTLGSIAMVAAIWFARGRYPQFFTPGSALAYWLVAMGLVAVSIFLSNDAKDVFGRNDPKQVIVDECAGQFITFFLIPISIRTVLLGLALFRFFDVVKPYPVHRLEELEDGIGITMDDVAAGVLANISLHAVLWIYHIIDAWL